MYFSIYSLIRPRYAVAKEQIITYLLILFAFRLQAYWTKEHSNTYLLTLFAFRLQAYWTVIIIIMVIIIVAGSSRCSQAHVETCYLSSRKDDDNSGSSVEGIGNETMGRLLEWK